MNIFSKKLIRRFLLTLAFLGLVLILSGSVSPEKGPSTSSPERKLAEFSFLHPDGAAYIPASCEGGVCMYPGGHPCYTDADCAPSPPPLVASCSVFPGIAKVGEVVTWSASASGGSGSYSYSWSGTDGLSGVTPSVRKAYSSVGTKTGSITVTSGGQTVGPVACRNSVEVIGIIVKFTAVPRVILEGRSSTLSWESMLPNCSIDQGIGSVSQTGSMEVSPRVTTIYTLTCDRSKAKTVVFVIPKPKFREVVPGSE